MVDNWGSCLGGLKLRRPLPAYGSNRELIPLLLSQIPLPGWGNSHHPWAERRSPEGGSRLARNDCPSVNNLLLPRASGSEARREHNGFLELKGPGRGASGDLRNAGGSESSTGVSCLALL